MHWKLVITGVVWLSGFIPIMWITIKKKSFSFTKKDMYSQKKSIYYSSRLHIYFLKNSFIDYVYTSFQISKHARYALKICISEFQFYYLIKITYNSSLTF
jgi:hypothetical protein